MNTGFASKTTEIVLVEIQMSCIIFLQILDQEIVVKYWIQVVLMLVEKHTKTPIIFPQKFEKLAILIAEPTNPATASDAFELYVRIIDAIENCR